jgi:hypothetical protein
VTEEEDDLGYPCLCTLSSKENMVWDSSAYGSSDRLYRIIGLWGRYKVEALPLFALSSENEV